MEKFEATPRISSFFVSSDPLRDTGNFTESEKKFNLLYTNNWHEVQLRGHLVCLRVIQTPQVFGHESPEMIMACVRLHNFIIACIIRIWKCCD